MVEGSRGPEKRESLSLLHALFGRSRRSINLASFPLSRTKGTVNAWIWSQNLGAIRIGPFTEVIDCGGAATMQYKRKVQDIRQEKKQERHQERLLPRWL